MKTLLRVVLLAPLLVASTLAGAAEEDTQEQRAKLEAQLREARERLAEATREVAELSARLGQMAADRITWIAGEMPRAMIGAQLESVKEGARVMTVSPGGPAAEAGLRAGDIIIEIDGKKLDDRDPARDVVRRVRRAEPESKLSVRALRDGKPMDFSIVTRSITHAPGVFAGIVRPPATPATPFWGDFNFNVFRGPLSGAEFATLTPQLGKYFGTEKGVLVVRAPEGDGSKLEDGDVILSIDGREPTSGSHATRILRSYQPGEKIKMKIMRQRKPMDIEFSLQANVRDDADHVLHVLPPVHHLHEKLEIL